MCIRIQMCVEASIVFPNTYLLKQDLSVELRAHQLSALALQIVLESHLSLPSTRIKDGHHAYLSFTWVLGV